MSFVNPLFLWALSLISVPIIIHLINIRRHKILYFSNTHLLTNIKKETQTRTNLKHILILLARIFTIIFLVLAFADPFIPNKELSNQSKPKDINIIYLDNSFSMEAEGMKGQLLQQAKQIAKEIIYNSKANMQYLLITNDQLSEHQHTMGRDMCLNSLDKINVSPNPIDINTIIQKSNTLINKDIRADLYVISDMQTNLLVETKNELKDNINAVFIPLIALKNNNIYIDTCWFNDMSHRTNKNEVLNVRVVNNSETEKFNKIPLQLYINDSLKAMTSFDIDNKQTKDVEISFVNTSMGYISAKLELTDYPITYDNTMYFNYKIEPQINVLIINSINANPYLISLFESDTENFNLTQTKLGNEQNLKFANFELIVLNNFSEFSSGFIKKIREFIDNGGSVVFIPSEKINYQSCNAFLKEFNAGSFETNILAKAKIKTIEYKHEIIRNIFYKQDKQLDLPTINNVLNYKINNSSPMQIVIGLDNNLPLLSAGTYDSGKLYVVSTSLNKINENFLKSPLFAPCFHNIAMNSQICNQLYYLIKDNQNIDMLIKNEINKENDILQIQSDNIDINIPIKILGKKINLILPPEIKEAKTYQMLINNLLVSQMSLNYNRSESVLKYYEDDKLNNYLLEQFNGKAKIISDLDDNFSSNLQAISEGKHVWQICILIALFFICIEMCLARFL